MAFTLTTIIVNGNNIGVATSIAGSGGYGEIVGLARASDNTAINPATDDTLQTIASTLTNGNARVQTQDLTPDAAQVVAALATGYLEQPGSFSATIQGTPGTTAALYAVVATNANGDTPLVQQLALSTVPNALSGSNYVAVQWSLVPGATGYKLVKSTNGGVSWVQVGSTLAGGVRSIADTGQSTSAYTPATASPALASVPYSLVGAASTNATSVAAGGRVLHAYDFFNGTASTVYVKLYNKATAPTVGTDTPLLTVGVSAGQGAALPLPRGAGGFPLGLALAVTANPAASDTTAVATGVIVNLFYT